MHDSVLAKRVAKGAIFLHGLCRQFPPHCAPLASLPQPRGQDAFQQLQATPRIPRSCAVS